MEDSIYKIYADQIRKIPLLSCEREKELAFRIQNGDERAKQILIKSNLRLVVSVALKYASPSFSLMDLIQEGNLGLMNAAAKFNAKFNTRFSTYAYLWIVQSITRFIRLKDTAIPLPALKEEAVRAVKNAMNELRQHFRREPTVRETAVFLNMEEQTVRDVLSYSFAVLSLDEKTDSCSGQTFSDLLVDYSACPETEVLNRITQRECEDLIRRLPPRESTVLLSRYRASVIGTKVTLQQIGRRMGLATESVRQIEVSARKKMRKVLCETQLC